MKIFENKNIKYLILPMIILTITVSITITIQTIKQYKTVTITLNEKIAEIMGKISESNPEMAPLNVQHSVYGQLSRFAQV